MLKNTHFLHYQQLSLGSKLFVSNLHQSFAICITELNANLDYLNVVRVEQCCVMNCLENMPSINPDHSLVYYCWYTFQFGKLLSYNIVKLWCSLKYYSLVQIFTMSSIINRDGRRVIIRWHIAVMYYYNHKYLFLDLGYFSCINLRDSSKCIRVYR